MPPKPTLFVVDDDPDILDLYKDCLDRCFHVQAFTRGQDAISAASGSRWPDSMIVDLMMPDLDGIQTMTQARSQGFVGPFVICSGVADKKFALQALAMKAFALIEKPFSSQELVNIMKHCVTGYKLTDINHRMLTLNSDLAGNAWDMVKLYEQRLAEAEHVMFHVNQAPNSNLIDLDHKSYYEAFARISQRIDVLRFELRQLQTEQEQLLTWRDLN